MYTRNRQTKKKKKMKERKEMGDAKYTNNQPKVPNKIPGITRVHLQSSPHAMTGS